MQSVRKVGIFPVTIMIPCDYGERFFTESSNKNFPHDFSGLEIEVFATVNEIAKMANLFYPTSVYEREEHIFVKLSLESEKVWVVSASAEVGIRQ